jgi:hypothetical protein
MKKRLSYLKGGISRSDKEGGEKGACPPYPGEEIMRLAKISRELRKERELAFYGDIDFIPTDQYKREDADEAMEGAKFVVAVATRMMRK